MYQNLAVLAALLVLYASLAGAPESKPVNGPLLFLLAGLVTGPSGLGLLNLSLDRNDLRLLGSSPFQSSCSMMPPRPTWPNCSNPEVPTNVRESLNVESGLNDGICVPVLLLLLALLTEAHSTMPFALAGYFFLEELGIGVLTGAALALLVGGLLRLSQRHCLQIEAWQQLVMPALALLSFASAQALGGSGFIAAFCAGLLLVRPPWARVHRFRDIDTGCAVARGWHDHRVHHRLRSAQRGIARRECIAGGAAAGWQRTRMKV